MDGTIFFETRTRQPFYITEFLSEATSMTSTPSSPGWTGISIEEQWSW